VFTDFNQEVLPFYNEFLDDYNAEGSGSEIQELDDGTYRAVIRLGPDRKGER